MNPMSFPKVELWMQATDGTWSVVGEPSICVAVLYERARKLMASGQYRLAKPMFVGDGPPKGDAERGL